MRWRIMEFIALGLDHLQGRRQEFAKGRDKRGSAGSLHCYSFFFRRQYSYDIKFYVQTARPSIDGSSFVGIIQVDA